METDFLKNGEVYNFFKTNGRQKCVEFLTEKNTQVSENLVPTNKSYEYSLNKLTTEIDKLKKGLSRASTKAQYDSFINSVYIFPKPDVTRRGPKTKTDEGLNLKEALYSEKIKTEALTKKLVLSDITNCNQIQQLNISNTQLTEAKLKLTRTAARENYATKKVKKLETQIQTNVVNANDCCIDKDRQILHLKQLIKEKEKEIHDLKHSVEYLNDSLNENNTDNEIINVFDDDSKRYSPSLKECVYELLQCNVSAGKVSNVIKSVLKMVGMKANKLPCKSSVLLMNLQRLYLAHSQLCEVFSKEKNTTLMTDETSKFGKKYMGYEAADSEGNLWVLGLRDIETKSANNTLCVFKEILSDLDEVSQSGEERTSKDIICHIKATMSDRAATEVKFNSLLEDYRKEILPLVYYNYQTFSEEERLVLENMSNFLCGLHALVNFAETAQKSVKEVENMLFPDKAPVFESFLNQEPGTCRLIRTAAKALGEGSGSDEKSGCLGTFKVYVSDFFRQNQMRSVPLKSFRGSRFNILFSNASALFFIFEQVTRFLDGYGAENRLLKSMLFDIKINEYLAGVKALGLISKFITCPLWSILEDKSISIVDMNSKYLHLVTFLEDASANVERFQNGQMVLFEDCLKKDQEYHALLTPRDFDHIVQTFLEVILPALCQLSRKLFKEHLPGGKLTNNVTPETSEALKGVPKTSCFAESVFGQMDTLMRTKPSLKTLAAESCIMFLNNKTLQWLQSKEQTEREKLINSAAKGVKDVKLKFKARVHEIEQRRKITIQEKIIQKENAVREKIRKQEETTNEMVMLWQSENEIDNMLESYETEHEKIQAVKVQLKFRKDVLLQTTENKQIFNFTKAVEGRKSRKSLDSNELSTNLKTLVKQSLVKDAVLNETRHILVGKRVRHRFKKQEGGRLIDEWYPGKIISQVPGFPSWFNIVYDQDEAVYTYHRLDQDLEAQDLEIVV